MLIQVLFFFYFINSDDPSIENKLFLCFLCKKLIFFIKVSKILSRYSKFHLTDKLSIFGKYLEKINQQ